MSSKKIAVTGSTGFLGGYIVAELLRSGQDDLVLLVRDKKRLENLYKTLRREGITYTPEMFHIVETELNNPRELAETLTGIDTVFHVAAVVSLSEQNPGEIIETNVEMTTHMVNAALESGVRLFVHTSSIAALSGMRKGKMYIDESSNLEDLSTTSPYGQSKFLSENELWRGSTLGLNVVVVNPAVILGNGEGSGSQIVEYLSKGIPIYTKGVVGYVDVRDVARAEVALSVAENAVGQRFVLSAGNLSFQQILNLAADASSKRRPMICAGRFLTEAAWRIDRLVSRIRGVAPTLTPAIARSSQEKSYYNGEKIRKYINFTYTPLEQTVRDVVKSHIDEKR